MQAIAGFFAPFLVYMCIFCLNALLPGRWVTGYATKPGSNEKLRYRLNGILVFFTVVLAWFLLGYFEFLSWNWLFTYRWYSLAGAIAFGLIFSFLIVLPFPRVNRNIVTDFFLGRLENPQIWGGRIDAKMWLYLVGAIMLELNILSFAAHHHLLYGAEASIGLFLATGLLSFFILDYLTFEEVHLYTYDFFAERVGFKLGWGCIAFYPFFYSIPIWSTTELASANTPTYLLVIYALIFFVGWSMARGANMQKYFFKKNSKNRFLGIPPTSITDGDKTLLVSGYWALSRHINYLGEITMAIGIVLCVGYPLLPWPWLYPLYYIALLFPRQIADDRRCAIKYGPLWQKYTKKVPYRIIPFIY